MSPEFAPLEIWGGLECSVNRVGDRFRDQTVLTGHQERAEDLDLFARLGLKAIRYPVLWERTETRPGVFDWSWPDARLARLRELDVRPIVGLVHHGSGPAWTNLLDPGFAAGLARFAAEAARRYPWVRDWTPVNEPLTTARFSALYGLWHPHRRDEAAFWTALVNQIDATRMAMHAIRAVNPEARLVQTEDVGRTFATEPCARQAEHENQRRLMTWDLLCGMVTREHPLYERLSALGLGDRLDRIAGDPCPPVLGVNHYVTSDRFLDHRLERYPEQLHGGNGELAYADVEAVRVLDPAPPGWFWHLSHVWDRYGLPMVVTECHLGCSREEQLRWLAECWRAAGSARRQGVRLEAVTAWNLLGGFDWNSLLTQENDAYESGVFDISDGGPRPTALAALVRDLAYDGAPSMNLAAEAGWWRRPQRLLYPPEPTVCEIEPEPFAPHSQAILCAAACATPELRTECEMRGLQLVVREEADPAAAWTYTSDVASPPGRIIDQMIDRFLSPPHMADVPCTRQMDTGTHRRV